MSTLEQPRSAHWGTIAEAAERYALSSDTIRRMIARNEIEAKRFGPRLIRVNLASIEDAAQPLHYAPTLADSSPPGKPPKPRAFAPEGVAASGGTTSAESSSRGAS